MTQDLSKAQKNQSFYITTAIDYPNGTPHMGHAYEKIITDCYARWYKMFGQDTYFLTGTDENGQKLVEAAKEKNLAPKLYVDTQVEHFRLLCKNLNISNDDFIRTTEVRHQEMAQHFWKILREQEDIYFGSYSGHYCLACESFYTEIQAPDLICPVHQKELTKKEEDGYFFKLSHYADWILDYIKTSEDFIVPKKARNEIISRIEQEPLKDIAISRPNNSAWGITVPDDESYVMYTWFDALINYYSALSNDQKNQYWPANIHVIGKDITWFHGVIWPCMLQAMKIALPKQIYVHGMILAADGRRMSKSLGNGADPQEIIAKFPLDTFRYYLLRAIPSAGDGRFSEKDLIEKNNNELGNDYGNLIMRVVKLAMKSLPDHVFTGKTITEPDATIVDLANHTLAQMKISMDQREHNRAMDTLWEAVNKVNQYVNNSEPWKLKNNPSEFEAVIYHCLFAIHITSQLLMPFLPETAKKALNVLGVEALTPDKIYFKDQSYKLSTPESFFPKIEVITEA